MKIRKFGRTAILFAAWLLCAAPQTAHGQAKGANTTLRLYIGTYTRGESKGIYRCEFDTATGTLTRPQVAAETSNPSFLALHPSGKFLYAVNETQEFNGNKTGSVSAFGVQEDTGDLTLLNQRASGGLDPCHLSLDRAGKTVFVANYSSGTLAALPVLPDGSVMPPHVTIQDQPLDAASPLEPHAHFIHLDSANRFAYAADLGLDSVFTFQIEKGVLQQNPIHSVNLPAGAGPRHFVFNPTLSVAYIINELNATIAACTVNTKTGEWKIIQTISTLPKGYKGRKSAAEIAITPNGKFLYASNRGEDSLALFTIDPKSGKLTPGGNRSSGGKTPRNFAIDPTGAFLLTANQDSNNVVVFRIAPKTGILTPTGTVMRVPAPVCLLFADVERH